MITLCILIFYDFIFEAFTQNIHTVPRKDSAQKKLVIDYIPTKTYVGNEV